MSAARRLEPAPAWVADLDGGISRPFDEFCVGVTHQMDSDRLLQLSATQSLRHVVQKQGFAYDRELEAARELVADPALLRHQPVGVILTPGEYDPTRAKGCTLVDREFSSSRQKHPLLGEIATALAGRPTSLVEDVLSVADELFTNAIYNAPFVNPVTGVNPGVSRTHPGEIQYDAGRRARFVVAADATRLIIGCADPFGSLNVPRYLFRIKETYVRGAAATMNFGPGGAGLGSYIIFNAGASLYAGVWPGEATVLFCVIPLGLSLRKRDGLPKHLHWHQG